MKGHVGTKEEEGEVTRLATKIPASTQRALHEAVYTLPTALASCSLVLILVRAIDVNLRHLLVIRLDP